MANALPTKHAQSAAAEINQKLAPEPTKNELVGRLSGPSDLTPEEIRELKSLLDRV